VVPPAVGDALAIEVLGGGPATGTVERVEEVRPMGGLPGMAWRLTVVLPGGARAEALIFGDARPAFLDPRYSLRGEEA
jgi:hypothetical protein